MVGAVVQAVRGKAAGFEGQTAIIDVQEGAD